MIVARYQSLGIDEVSLNDGMATHMISPASWLEGKIAYEDMANRLFYIENRHIGAVDLSSGDDVRWLY